MSEALAREEAMQPASTAPPNPFTTPLISPSTEEIITSVPVDHFGTLIYVKVLRHIVAKNPPMILIHDIGEHSDCYMAAAQELLDGGYSVYLYDLRGHGRSGRQLGHAPSFQAHVQDLLQVAAWVRFKEDGRAPIVIGQGIGAIIAMDFSKAYPSFCRAAVLSAPCFKLATPLTALQRLVIRFLADVLPMMRLPLFLTPKLSRENWLSPVGSSQDSTAQPRFPGLTAAFTHKLLTAINDAEERFVHYRGTALVLCPEHDKVCGFQALMRQAAVHQEANLEVVSLTETSHQVFNSDSASRSQAVQKVLSWLGLKNAPVGPVPAVVARNPPI